MAKPAKTQPAKELAKVLYYQGFNSTQVAEKSKVNLATLKTWIRRESWSIARMQGKQEIESACAPALAVQVANDMNARSKAAQEGLAEVLTGQIEVLKKNPGRTIGQLRNTPQGQGSAAVAKTIAETASKVFGWDAAQSRSIVNVNILNQVPDGGLDKTIDV